MMNYWSNEKIEAKIAKAKELGLPTRYDEILLGIHPDDRMAAEGAARRMLNMTPDAGRPSDALRTASRDYRSA